MNYKPLYFRVLGDFVDQDATGVALLGGEPCKVRELAVHSASAEMAINPIIAITRAIHAHYAGLKLRENLREVPLFLADAITALERAKELMSQPAKDACMANGGIPKASQ